MRHYARELASSDWMQNRIVEQMRKRLGPYADIDYKGPISGGQGPKPEPTLDEIRAKYSTPPKPPGGEQTFKLGPEPKKPSVFMALDLRGNVLKEFSTYAEAQRYVGGLERQHKAAYVDWR